MSTRYKNGSHYGNHQRAAELHDGPAHTHSSAAEDREKQDYQTGQEQSQQDLEHSEPAYQHSYPVHQKHVNRHGIATFGQKEIAELAYALWHARGCPQGSPEEDWFHAAHQLRARAETLPN